MKKIILAVLLLCFFSASIATAKIYKWRDENGKLHFSDTPPVTEQKVKGVNIKDNKATGVPKPNSESTPMVQDVLDDPPTERTEGRSKESLELLKELVNGRLKGNISRERANEIERRLWELDEEYYQREFKRRQTIIDGRLRGYKEHGDIRFKEGAEDHMSQLCRQYKYRVKELDKGVNSGYIENDSKVERLFLQYEQGMRENCQ